MTDTNKWRRPAGSKRYEPDEKKTRLCNDCRKHRRAVDLHYSFVRNEQRGGLMYVGAYCGGCFEAAAAFRRDTGMAPYIECKQAELFKDPTDPDLKAMSEWFAVAKGGER